MFDGLIAFFVGLWNGVKYLYDVAWKWIHNIWGWALLVTLSLFHLAKHTTEFIAFIVALLPGVANTLADWSNPNNKYVALFGVASYVFPLDELFGAFTIIFVAYVTGTIYRLIKSWIPTLS